MPREKMFRYFDGERDRYYEYVDGRWVEMSFYPATEESRWEKLVTIVKDQRDEALRELEREKASRKEVAEKLENAERGIATESFAKHVAWVARDAEHERAEFYAGKVEGLQMKVNELERRLSLEQAAHLESERALRERMNEIRDSQNEDARACAIGFRLNHHNGCLCSRCLDAMKASEKYWNKTAAPDDRIK